MKYTISKLLLRWLALSIFTISFNNLVAQNLKFKLEFIDNVYLGTMSPNWYDEIQITPIGKDNKLLEGATGIMSGERFGIMKFQIEKNNTKRQI